MPISVYPNIPSNSDYNELINEAINETYGTFGDRVSVQDKAKTLLKFGESTNVTSSITTLQEFANSSIINETYATANTIDRVVTDDSFTGTVRIEGHTISGTDLTFVTQEVTMTGTTPVVLPTPLARATRVFNTSTTAVAATKKVYVYDSSVTTITSGAPSAGYAGVKVLFNSTEQQSLKASTSFSSTDYAFVREIYATTTGKAATSAILRFQIRPVGGIFRTVFKTGFTEDNSALIALDPLLIVPKNYDVRLTAEVSAGTKSIAGGFNCYLASVQ